MLEEDTPRRLHGKIFEVLCKRGRILLSGSANATTSRSFAVSYGILMRWLVGCASAACVCRLQSRRADASARHRIVAAAAGVCRSTQTGLAAYSSPAPSAQTSARSPRGYADAVRRARGA